MSQPSGSRVARLFLAGLIIVGAGSLWWKLKTPPPMPAPAETSDTAPAAESVSNASPAHEATPAGASTPAPPVISSSAGTANTKTWTDLLREVRLMDPESSEGLENAYARARTEIGKDPNGSFAAFRDMTPRLGELELTESFFAVSAFMRFSDSPVQILSTLLENRPPADPVKPGAHHEAMTPSVAYDRIEAFAVRELRERLAKDPQALGNERNTLVNQLTERARNERSLDISIEMLQTLKALNEKHAIESVLSGHSRRDQEILRSAIADD